MNVHVRLDSRVLDHDRVLQHLTASPDRIGDLANAALVLTQFEHRYVYG
jgi:hypothetical protein